MSCHRMNLRVLPRTEDISETEQIFAAAGLQFRLGGGRFLHGKS